MSMQLIFIGSTPVPLVQHQGWPVVVFAIIDPVQQYLKGVDQQPGHRHAPE